jgi:hypothetical protein
MSSFKDDMAAWVAVFLIVTFTCFNAVIMFLLMRNSMGDALWGHYIYLLTAASSVTSIAVGWLFGRKEAQMAEKRAAAAEQSAEKGKILAEGVMAHKKLQQAIENSKTSNTPKSANEVALDAHMDELVAECKEIL